MHGRHVVNTSLLARTSVAIGQLCDRGHRRRYFCIKADGGNVGLTIWQPN